MSRRRALAVVPLVAAILHGAAPPAAAAPDEPAAPGQPARRPGEVLVVAGTGETGYSGDGWDAREARLGGIVSVDVAPDGTVFVADYGNGRLRRVGADGVIDTVRGTRSARSPETDSDQGNGWIYSPSNRPRASDVTSDGTLYLAGAQDIRRITPDGKVAVLGGNGETTYDPGNGGDGGPATQAWIYKPGDIAADESGNVYIADTNNFRVRKIDRHGTITTIAGGGDLRGTAAVGKPATRASIGSPDRLVTDGKGTVYFSQEQGRTVFRVGKDGRLAIVATVDSQEGHLGITGLALDDDGSLYVGTATGEVQRVAPGGKPAPVPGLRYEGNIFDLAVGPDGDLYVGGSAIVQRIVRGGETTERPLAPGRSPWAADDPGTVHRLAGTGRELSDDERIRLQQAYVGKQKGPSSVAVGKDGTVYVAEPAEHRVRAIDPDGRVRAFAGSGEDGRGAGGGDGEPAEQAPLSAPSSVAVDPDGFVLIADSAARAIREVDPDGIIDTAADVEARQLTVGTNGTVYLTADDHVYRLGDGGKRTPVAGGGDRWADKADGAPAAQASLWEPGAVAADGGSVYFAESGKPSVRAVRPNGVLVTVAGNSYLEDDEGGFAGDGGPATRAELNQPSGLAIGRDGARYIADAYNNRIRRIDRAGVITTVAGTGERADRGDGGPATKAALTEPTSVAVGPDGALYVTSTASSRVRRIDPDGTIDTLADLSPGAADDEATKTDLSSLSSLNVAVDGTVYVGAIDGLRKIARDGTFDPAVPGADVSGSLGTVALTRDGSVLVLLGATLRRYYPDGGSVTTLLGGPGRSPRDNPSNLPDLRDVVAGPRDEVYVGSPEAIYRVTADGSLNEVYGRRGDGDLGRFTVAADGTVYVLREDQLLRVRDGRDEPLTAAESTYRPVEEEDGGPAIEAGLSSPDDLAVAEDGTLFVSTAAGVRRVDTDGDIHTVVPNVATDSEHRSVDLLATGPGGDLYLGYSDGTVDVLVRPREITDPVSLMWLFWTGLAVLVLGGATLTFLLRRRATARAAIATTTPGSAPEPGPAPAPVAEHVPPPAADEIPDRATKSEPATEPTPDRDTESNAQQDTEPTTEPNAKPNTKPDAEPDAQPDAEPATEPDAEPNAEPDTKPNAEPDAEPTTEPDVEPATEPDAKPDTEPGAEPDTKPNAEPNAQPDAQPDAEPATEPDAEPATEPDAEPATEPDAEPTTEPDAEPDTKPGAEPGAEAEATPEAPGKTPGKPQPEK